MITNSQIENGNLNNYNKLTIEVIEDAISSITNNNNKYKYDTLKDGYIGNGLYCLGGVAYCNKKAYDSINEEILRKYKTTNSMSTKRNARNFISTCGKYAINSYGDTFMVGDIVKHSDNESGNSEILSFYVDDKYNEVTAVTDKGNVHIDFIEIINEVDDNCELEIISTYAIEEIKRERIEQIYKHGFGINHDSRYSNNDALSSAAVYCITGNDIYWPNEFDVKYKEKIKDKDKTEKLIVAGAFIAAQIDSIKHTTK